MCNTQNSLLLNQHKGDDAPQDWKTKDSAPKDGKLSLTLICS